ncbi:hypothetical protein [Dactylosporangium sp. NPDC005555]|uniref:hypothetical protein n=1 Tax=Dactylosporangium sp. NPDC005555 TaxID=3154889 RepID=UPI0033BB0ADF
MDVQVHPAWCARNACTAYGVEGDRSEQFERWHRSDPLIIKRGDPAVGIFIHKFAEPDGSDEHIELAALALPTVVPWYLAEPVADTTILLPLHSADAVWRAVAELS